ncbi:MAG TPA: hypothetical protein VJ343_00075 [archaeon]|nr:hypothetical protein [archaeon]
MARMQELKSVDMMSYAKISGAIGAIGGFVLGVIVALFAGVGVGLMYEMPGAGLVGGAVGIAAIIIFPIMYAVIGFVSAAVGALLYNFVASKIGGVKIELG